MSSLAPVVLRWMAPSHIVLPSKYAAVVSDVISASPPVTGSRLRAVTFEYNLNDEDRKREGKDARKGHEEKIAFYAAVRREEEEKKIKLDDGRKKRIESSEMQVLENERNIQAKIAERARLLEEKKAEVKFSEKLKQRHSVS